MKRIGGISTLIVAIVLAAGCSSGANQGSADTTGPTTTSIPTAPCSAAMLELLDQTTDALAAKLTTGADELSGPAARIAWNGLISSCRSRDDFYAALYSTPGLSKEFLDAGAKLTWEGKLNRYCAENYISSGICAKP